VEGAPLHSPVLEQIKEMTKKRFRLTVLLCASLTPLMGCTLQEATDTPNPATQTASADTEAPKTEQGTPQIVNPTGKDTEAPAGETTAAPPMAGMPAMGDPMAPLTPTPDMDKAIEEANKSGDKAKIAEAYTKRGVFRMTDDGAGARIKYRAALSDLRKALAAVPDKAEAKQAKEQIESIYESMGRPVPTDDVP
jgi:hypothetical protein